MKITKGTIIRTIGWTLALLNLFAWMLYKGALPLVQKGDIYYAVVLLGMIFYRDDVK